MERLIHDTANSAVKKAVLGRAELECDVGRVVDQGLPVFFREREHTQDPAHSEFAIEAMDLIAEDELAKITSQADSSTCLLSLANSTTAFAFG